MQRFLFELQYLLHTPPWDTNISPPELMSFIDTHTSGRAIDLGCGTGTNAITLAQHGWDVVGIDFSTLAIHRAKRKAQAYLDQTKFVQGDVSKLEGIHGPFDLALDIGCFHSLSAQDRDQYVKSLVRVMADNGTYLLYAWLTPVNQLKSSPDVNEIHEHFQDQFDLINTTVGSERGQRPSAWFEMRLGA